VTGGNCAHSIHHKCFRFSPCFNAYLSRQYDMVLSPVDCWLDLWKDGVREVIEEVVSWHALHTAGEVCTGVLSWAVGSVGKMGRNRVSRDRFSKCPEIHGRVLEKWDGVGSRMGSGLGRCFHFSTVNYGYYGNSFI